MKRLLLLTAIFLTACGPSQEEKKNVAAVTCSIMGETRNMDAAVRVREMNDAREKIGGEPFLRGDDAIQEAFEWGLCQKLVLNEIYDETLQSLKDTKRERERIAAEGARIAREKREETARIAREKREETARIESELAFAAGAKNRVLVKKLLAEGKEVSLHANGQISMIRPNEGSSYNGNVERFYKNGQMMFKAPYQNGKKEGISEYYDYDGNLTSKKCFKDGSEISLEKCK